MEFAYDYGQLYLYDVGGGVDFSDDRNPTSTLSTQRTNPA